MPPKKKAIKEPKVDVPEGDASAGRGVFDAKCSACHAFEGNFSFFSNSRTLLLYLEIPTNHQYIHRKKFNFLNSNKKHKKTLYFCSNTDNKHIYIDFFQKKRVE